MKLSIITINYNNLNGLKKTVDSVLSQTWRDFEWIIIDGGSTDGSKEFIEDHQDKFSFWCSKPDKGVYHAMNKGIIKAKGDYLNFMNSGDIYHDVNSLKAVFELDRSADVVYGAMLLANGKLDHESMMKPNIKWFDICRDTIPHQASFIRRNLFESIGMYEESFKIASDWYFFAKAMVQYRATFEFIPRVLADFEGGGVSDNSAIAERENAQFHLTIFGPMLLANYERAATFDIIQEHRFSAKLLTVLLKLVNLYNRFTSPNSKIIGIRK